jgi:hypothetical protein
MLKSHLFIEVTRLEELARCQQIIINLVQGQRERIWRRWFEFRDCSSDMLQIDGDPCLVLDNLRHPTGRVHLVAACKRNDMLRTEDELVANG